MQLARFCSRLSFLIAALIIGESDDAIGQQNSSAKNAGGRGIRHQISALVRADPALYGQHSGDPPDNAMLTVRVLISDNSQEFRFFGEVSANFSDFAPKDGSLEQIIWQNVRCHHERGIPKFTVTAIEGLITDEQMQLTVSAHVRHIGLRVPSDEVTQGKRLVGGTDNIGAFTVTRVETKHSHLFVDLKLYTLRCDLE